MSSKRCIGTGKHRCDKQTHNAGGRCTSCLNLAERTAKQSVTMRRLHGTLKEDRPRALRLGRAAFKVTLYRPKNHGSFQS